MPVYRSETATKDGRKYYFTTHTTINGVPYRYKSKKYKYAEEAKKAEARYLLNLNKSIATRYTFAEMIEEYVESKRGTAKPTTLVNINACLNHAKKALGGIRIDKLTSAQWAGFLTYLKEQPMKNHRRNRIIEYTNAVISYANKRYDIYTNIPSKYEKFNEKADKPLEDKMEFWTPQQFATFISVVDDVMYRALFTLLYATGMRSGEALALSWKDVDFEANTISITKTVSTKIVGQKYVVLTPKTQSSIRTIRAPQKALERLLEYREQVISLPQYSPTAFVFGIDKPIPNTTLQKAKHKYYLLAHDLDETLPEIRIHSFRHSCASALISSGATIVYISKYLGHSSTKETLDTYSHFFPNESDFIAGKMDELL